MSTKFVAILSKEESNALTTVTFALLYFGLIFVLYYVTLTIVLLMAYPNMLDEIIEKIANKELLPIDLDGSAFDMFCSIAIKMPFWVYIVAFIMSLAHFFLFPKFLRVIFTIFLIGMMFLLLFMNTDGSFITISRSIELKLIVGHPTKELNLLAFGIA